MSPVSRYDVNKPPAKPASETSAWRDALLSVRGRRDAARLRTGIVFPQSVKKLLQEAEFGHDAIVAAVDDKCAVPGKLITKGRNSFASAHWGDGFPTIMIHTTLANVKKKYSDLHASAKAGDAEAGAKLIEAVVKTDRVIDLARRHPNAIVCAPHAEEMTGRNTIPAMYARFISSATGLDVDAKIVQSVRAHHTGADGFGRLIRRPQFAGEVEAGREYILVDDHVTMGGTLNELRAYIESHGGKVVEISTLTASRGSTTIAIKKETVEAIRSKFGEAIDEELREAGIAGDVETLTEGEGRYILTFSPDTLRNRIAEGRQEESDRVLQEAVGKHSDELDGESTPGQYSLVSDKKVLDAFQDADKYIETYRTFQLVNGKLYSPMAAKTPVQVPVESGPNKGQTRTKWIWTDPVEMGKAYKADERPDLAVLRPSDGKYYTTLNKGNGASLAVGKDGVGGVAYNPYWHSSNLALNDQFSSAEKRPNLVTVKCRVLKDDFGSGYHAEKAKDPVGAHRWHTGVVTAQLENTERIVYLTQYIMPVEVVSDREVAQMYKETFNGEDIAVPQNVVTPSLANELRSAGIRVLPYEEAMKDKESRAREKKARGKSSLSGPSSIDVRMYGANTYFVAAIVMDTVRGRARSDEEYEKLKKQLHASLDVQDARVISSCYR